MFVGHHIYENFFLVSGKHDHKLYLLDPIEQELKMVKKFGGNPLINRCTCYENTLLLSTNGSSTIEVYHLSLPAIADDDESIMKSLEQPINILKPPTKYGKGNTAEHMCISSDGKYSFLGLKLHQMDFDTGGRPESFTWFELRVFRHDDGHTLKMKKSIDSVDDVRFVALPDEKILIISPNSQQVTVLDYSTSTTTLNDNDDSGSDDQNFDIKETKYSTQSSILAASICGNCLVAKTSESEISFYDL